MENNGKIPKRIEPDRCRKQLTFNIPTELSFCRSGANYVINREELPKVLQRDIEELESYYHSGDFVGYDCCLETLEATVKQCCIHGSISGKQLDTIFRRYGLR